MVTHCTSRMPPHSSTVLRYQSGKCPSLQASAKFDKANGPAGNSEAMSSAPASSGRNDATAIQANGIAQSNDAAQSSSVTSQGVSRLIVDPALQRTQRHDR